MNYTVRFSDAAEDDVIELLTYLLPEENRHRRHSLRSYVTAEAFGLRSSTAAFAPSSLIPVLVTGIQQRRVCGAEEPFHANDFA